MKARVTDLETQNHPHYGQLASAKCEKNYVVMEAWEDITFGNGPFVAEARQERRFSSREEWLDTGWNGAKRDCSVHIPADVTILVAHNAAYEMSWWLEHAYDEFIAFLKRGGRVYCTAYAHYLVSNFQDIYPSLNETAPLYGGTPKVDAVKALWEAGYLTADIDQELLSEYLSGPMGDIANTTKVFLGTWDALQKRGMLKMAMVRMDALLWASVCMHHGLKIDMEVASELQKENEEWLTRLNVEVRQLFPDDMPQEARDGFKFSSLYAMSAFVFGGPLKYPARVPRTDSDTGALIYVKKEGPFFKAGKETYVLPEEQCEWDAESGLWYDARKKVHQARYTAGKNKGLPKVDKYVTDEVELKNGDLIYNMPGIIDDNCRTNLAESIAGEWTGKLKLADGSPVISTAGDVLDALAAQGTPAIKPLQLIAKIEKDLGSFYLQEKKGKLSGMLQYVQLDGFIHHALNSTSTVTGRLSASTPNLQQIPRAEEVKPGDFKSKVKAVFVSRFGADGGILQEDYSALETVGLQVYSKDQNLKNALLKDLDMHSIRLASMEGLDYDWVVLRTKDDTHPEHGLWHVKRTAIKPVAFQYQYGATAYGMMMSTGKSQQFCQDFIDAEKLAFPEVESWFEDKVFAEVYATSLKLKPIRLQLDDGRIVQYRIGTYTDPAGNTWQFRQVSKNKWNPLTKKREEVREFKIPQMRNYPIQGGSGFLVNLACGMLIRHFIANDFYGGKCLPINVVHDATYYDCHNDVAYQAAYEVEAIMECIPEMLNHLWPAFGCEVPFPVAGGFGPNMAIENKLFDKAGKAEFIAKKAAFKEQFLASKGVKIQFIPH